MAGTGNDVFDSETNTWVKQEGTATGQTEVVVTGSAEGEELAIKARQPELLDSPPLGDTFAVPVRQVGSVDVVVVGAPAQAAAVDGLGSGLPVRTVNDGMIDRLPELLETDGEGGGGRLKISVGQNGLPNEVDNPVYVRLSDGEISSPNSTDVPLGSDGAFIGEWADVLRFTNVSISLSTDQASALGGVLVEWSSDGLNVDSDDSFTVPDGGVGTVYTFNPTPRYMRVSYTNGAIAQGFLRLQTILRRASPKPSSHGLTADLGDYHDAELVRAVLAAKKRNVTPVAYTNIAADPSGNLIVTTPSQAAETSGFIFGKVVLASTTPTAIRATIYTEQTSNAQRSIVSTSANDTAAGTGARAVRVVYFPFDLSGPFEEVVPTNGLTPVNMVATDVCFIETMDVPLDSFGSGLTNAGVISLKAAVAGGGATIWSIAAGDKQAFGAHHYVPPGKSARITGFACGIKGADTAGFEVRKAAPTSATPAAEVVVSDHLRCPSGAQAPMRIYSSPIEIDGPAKLTIYVLPDSTSSRTYYASFDFFEVES